MPVRIEEVIGQNVRSRREELEMTQEELGRRVGGLLGREWPRQTVFTAEKGGRSFTAAELVAFAFVLDVSIERLFRLPLGERAIQLATGVGLDHAALRQSAEDGGPVQQKLEEMRQTLRTLFDANAEAGKAQRWTDDAVRKLNEQMQDALNSAGAASEDGEQS
ncbi:hypothetical protein IN07_03365 [Modestobacter caceresii]|uniref:HTH cro/C1-type domain-containing protein n=1 Tax=Modestobacter caceresii TaxID=1522368 RepID=A0A098YCR4_9ACTN|nr:hypothetical protein IN07_03365 [Modestobacter caceresii]